MNMLVNGCQFPCWEIPVPRLPQFVQGDTALRVSLGVHMQWRKINGWRKTNGWTFGEHLTTHNNNFPSLYFCVNIETVASSFGSNSSVAYFNAAPKIVSFRSRAFLVGMVPILVQVHMKREVEMAFSNGWQQLSQCTVTLLHTLLVEIHIFNCVPP